MLLRKMGWTDHSSPTFNSPRFDHDKGVVKFYIRPGTIYIFIKELSEEEKQISKNSYKFVYNKREIEFNSNMELLRLIIENEACNEDYKRHFKLNKLLK
jgi:hypothetical protein